MLRRILICLSLALAILVLAGGRNPQLLQAKNPAWQSGEHPRLLATTSERAALVSKLNAANTTSRALWQYFLQHNNAAATTFVNGNFNYADAGAQYWIAQDATNGQRAHDAVMNYIGTATSLAVPDLSKGYEQKFWNYRDMLINFDFAYDRFSPAERQQVYQRILLQGARCHTSGASWAPGNIASLWALCEYASGVMLDGENFSVTVVDEPVVRGSGTKDGLAYAINYDNVTIRSTAGGAITFTQPTDYDTGANASDGGRWIDWAPAGAEPSTGATYYVSYTVNPRIDQWRLGGRMFLDNHFNYNWRDGNYSAGFHPYSGAALENVLDMVEIARRDLGVDYSLNADLKKYIDMALYEWLPSTATINGININGSLLDVRYDMFNDAGNWLDYPVDHPGQSYQLLGWVRRMVSWGTAHYANDPQGYGQRYMWYWQQMYLEADGTLRHVTSSSAGDWREAFWFNDQLTGSYPIQTRITPVWPTYRFFRGNDLVIARTDHFGTRDHDATYLSLTARNHNYQNEHDQGDSGSFTYYANQEDWAIDPGYQKDNGSGANSYDHNTVGIDGNGVNAGGIYGISGTTPRYGGFANIDTAALTESASAMRADLTHFWSLTSTPFVDHQYRYMTMVTGAPSTYVVIGDDIQEDNSTHTYQWYLNTGYGNTVTRTGDEATVVGARTGAELHIYTVSPNTTSETIEDWAAGNFQFNPYTRLTIRSSSVVNPYFLNLLIPTPSGVAQPAVQQSTVTNGVQAVITWSNGMIDTVLWRTGGSTLTDGTYTTDARLAIIRNVNAAPAGLLLMQGRSLTKSGQPLVTAGDGTQPMTVSAFDTTAAVTGRDVSRVQLALPNITAAHASDGDQALQVTSDGTYSYIVGGVPFDAVEQQQGQLLSENFNDGYMADLFDPNLDRYPATDQAIVGGVLDLRTTTQNWISRSKRDSTPWRRSGLTPTANPPDSFGDADYSFTFRFTDATDASRKFRAYFLVHDRADGDYVVNQDYLRLELNPVNGQVTIGRRNNGAWSDLSSNDVLTGVTNTTAGSFNDANWHTVQLRILNGTVRLMLDNVEMYNGAIGGTVPTTGYLQWRVIGTSHVQLDDLAVEAVDMSTPAAPSSGSLGITPSGQATASLKYDQGLSPDAATLTLLESDAPILPATNPATLTVIGFSSNIHALSVPGALAAANHAVMVTDTSGNRSVLLPLTTDSTAPSQVLDLQSP